MTSLGEQGHLAYHMFTNVIKLSVNQRVQGLNIEQSQFRDLLMRLRTGDCTEPDWQLLLTRKPNKVQNVSEFHDATRLYFSNEEVANYNFDKLSALPHPIARVNARHSKSANLNFRLQEKMRLDKLADQTCRTIREECDSSNT